MLKSISIFLLFSSFIGHSQKKDNTTNYKEATPLVEVVKYHKLMGSTFVLTVIDSSYARANRICEEAIEHGTQIEAKISSWNAHSQTSKINKYAGIIPVKVDKDLYDLIARSKKISDLTEGAFDISYASLDKVWDFTKDSIELPSQEKIATAVSKINYKNIILNPQDTTVFLKEPGMKIGFGGIGKGYLADEVKKFLLANGVQSGIVNSGGDLITWGSPIYDTAWDIGIANPRFKNSVLGKFKIKDQAIATSGDYEKFVTIEGKKYCHIINPKTGYPVAFLNSVSVLCNSAELADALATAVFVLGEDKGIELVNKLKGIEAIAIKGEEIFASSNIEIENEKRETVKGEFIYFADNCAFKQCGTSNWVPNNFKDKLQIYAEKTYLSLKDNNPDNTVLITAKGRYLEEDREGRMITVFEIDEIVKMELGKCE